MIREVDLVSYLPPFMQKYKEPVAALDAENPEFYFIWDSVNRILYNHFIGTADEYGISRYERMLGIFPAEDATLDNRRQAILLKWAAIMPYTLRNLKKCLSVILGDRGYILQNYSQEYLLNIILIDKTEDTYHTIENMLSDWIPINMGYMLESRQIVSKETKLYTGSLRAEVIKIKAAPVKEDNSFRATVKVNMKIMSYEYWKVYYQPKGEIA